MNERLSSQDMWMLR